MSHSLIEEIIQQEEALHARISAGKHRIRARLDKQQQELEARHELFLKCLKKRSLSLQRRATLETSQRCKALEDACEETIDRESSLAEDKILRIIEDCICQELQRGSHDYKDVQS